MIAYKYDSNTKEYIGEIGCQVDQLAGKGAYLVPGNATIAKPNKVKSGYSQVWNGQAWEDIIDYRGRTYWTSDSKYGEAGTEMKELGELPEGATFTEPTQSLEELKALALSVQYNKYNAEKYAIAWLADGSGYGFDTDKDSQTDWLAVVQVLTANGSNNGNYRVYVDKNDITKKEFKAVTLTQLIEAGNISRVQQTSAYETFEKVKKIIQNATTKAELQAYI